MNKNTIKNIIIIVLVFISIFAIGEAVEANDRAQNYSVKLQKAYSDVSSMTIEYETNELQYRLMVNWALDAVDTLGNELLDIGYEITDNETTHMYCLMNEETQRYVILDYTDLLALE